MALFAQPSDDKVKADIKKEYPHLKITGFKTKGTTSAKWENNVKVLSYARTLTAENKIDDKRCPSCTYFGDYEVWYKVNQGNYSYHKLNPKGGKIQGMPNPNINEILSFLNENKLEIFKANANQIIGMPEPFVVDQNTKFNWVDIGHLEFDTWLVYEEFINDIGDARKVKDPKKITLRSDENGNWKFLLTNNSANFQREIISEKRYTAKERDKMQTFESLLNSESAKQKVSSLKTITLPNMKDKFEVVDFVHSQFLTADKSTIESMLYQMLPSFYFSKNDKNVLTRNGQELIDKVLQSTVSGDFIYNEQYCPKPELKENGGSYIDYWNKNKTAYTRLEIGTEDNKWKLGNITIYIISLVDKAEQIEKTACGSGALSAVQRGEKNANQKITKNDWVLAYYDSDGYWYPAFYLGFANNYYDIQYFQGNAKSKVRKVIPFSPEVGDKCYVKLQSGQMTEVTIKSIKNTDIVIDFNGKDTNYKLSGVMFK